jgi:DNA-binding MarR family transcriptional regulator
MTNHQRPLTESQALAWLHGQPDCTIATTVSDLARSWGRNRSTTSRRVKAWVASGQLVRTPRPDGRSLSQRGRPMCHRRPTPRPPSLPRQRA